MWDKPDNCKYWIEMISAGKDLQNALTQISEKKCTLARGPILERFSLEELVPDLLSTLVVLGQSPEAEEGLKRALKIAASREQAAKTILEWKLKSMFGPLKESLLAIPVQERSVELVRAALETAPPDEWIELWIAALHRDARPTVRELALKLIAQVDWASNPKQGSNAASALSLIILNDAKQRASSLSALAQIPLLPPVALPNLRQQADQNSCDALLLLWSLGDTHAYTVAQTAVLKHTDSTVAKDCGVPLYLSRPSKTQSAHIETLPKKTTEGTPTLRWALTFGKVLYSRIKNTITKASGDIRAEAVRALPHVANAAELKKHIEHLKSHPSVLIREVVSSPAFEAEAELVARCDRKVECLLKVLADTLPTLEKWAQETRQARKALQEAQKKAEAAVALDNAAKTPGDSTKSVSLEKQRAHRDVAYKQVQALGAELDTLLSLQSKLVLLFRQLMDASGDKTGKALEYALEFIQNSRSAELAPIRPWATALVQRTANSANLPALKRFIEGRTLEFLEDLLVTRLVRDLTPPK